MNDCVNADIRDRLPDLLHGQLDLKSRAEVSAHVDDCVDCRDELELLRSVQKTLMAQAPRVDITYVLGALPKPPAKVVPIRSARRQWADWRVAAAITILAAGGSSLALLKRGPTGPSLSDTVAVAPMSGRSGASQNAPAPGAAQTLAVASGDDADAADVGPDGRFGGLSDGQLRDLLGQIDRLEAVPVTEPEPVSIRMEINPLPVRTP